MSTENEGGLFSCPVMCWIIGALLGVATYLILAGRFMMGTSMALIAAVVVFAVVGYMLGRLFCRASGSTHGHTARHDQDIAATKASVVAADSAGAMVSGVPDVATKTTSTGASAATAGTATATKTKTAAKPAAKTKAKAAAKPAAKAKAASKSATKTKAAAKPKAAAKSKAAAKPKAAVKPKAAAKPKTASKAATTSKTATKPAAKAAAKPATKAKAAIKPAAKAKAATKPAAKAKTTIKPAAKPTTKPAAKAAAKKPAAKTATKPARKAVAKDGKPEMLKKARAGGADDLKQIKGVGPKLEGKLNDMGLYHFDQVAAWRAKEVEWADNNLVGFKGRVSRDEWVKQAKVLAKGGQTEFSKKVAKGGVYEKNKK